MVRTSGCALVSTAVLALALAGCGVSTEPEVVAAASDGKAKPVKTLYDLAGRCFVLKANDAYAVRSGDGFAATGADADSAERFYMQATGLGRYLFYTADRKILTAAGGAVTAADQPEDGSDWTFAHDQGEFAATTLGQSLATGAGGAFVLADQPARLAFESASGCTAYPEMPLDIGETFRGRNAKLPVIGFAEVHSHMGMGSEMSDGSGNVGPSAGGVMYGQAVNRFGVVEALKNCEGPHGQDGVLSPEWLILDGGDAEHAQHDTQGWPSFIDWPQKDSQLHQQMYYRWVERAYRAGLRTMVIHGTNIEVLCNVAKNSGNDKDADLQDTDCTDMGVGVKQVQYLYDMENYIDAQQGGPGKGWFRIVRDPKEARDVIADGKLAVVPGLEFSNIFHCSVTFLPDGSETSGCTREDIDREIDEVWDLGVRAVFPYHDVDSALGGTGIFDGAALNLVGFSGTHGFWKTYDCEDGGEGPTYFYNAGAYMYDKGAPAGFGDDPLTGALIENTQGLLPTYPTGRRQCNARDVTDLGKYAIRKIMEKGFTLDIDHAEIRSKQYMLDEGAKLTPNYPMISGHGGHGGISNAQAAQIIRQGGIIYPAIENGKDMANFILHKLKPIWLSSGTQRPLAVGYGADSNGLRNLPGPRGAGTQSIQYPFTLFKGDGWGPQFKAAGIAPVKVDLLSIPGGQSWNMDEVGMAHYGLVPDIVEEIRIEGGEEATTAFYNSAETYLEMWEQTLAAAAAARR